MKIRFIEGQKGLTFAPKGGITFPKKNYLPGRCTLTATRLEGNFRMKGAWGNDFMQEVTHEIEIQQLNNAAKKQLKRTLIAYRNARVTSLKIEIDGKPYILSLKEVEPCFKRLKNTILEYLTIQNAVKSIT